MDRQLRQEIRQTVERTVREVLEGSEEKWLSGEQLTAQFGFITKDWLKRYGELLPRERIEVRDPQGQWHTSRWAYPQHRIQRMIHERKLTNLQASPADVTD